jgi:hypothetical protein
MQVTLKGVPGKHFSGGGLKCMHSGKAHGNNHSTWSPEKYQSNQFHAAGIVWLHSHTYWYCWG